MEPTQPIQINKVIITLLVAFLLVFIGTSILLWWNEKTAPVPVASTSSQNQPSTVIPPTTTPKEGYIKLQTIDPVNRMAVGQTKTINIVIDSNNETITGWDLLVTYPASLEFVDVKSSLTDFKVYSFNRDDHVSITAIKSLESSTASIFKDTVVATLTFRAKEIGAAEISLVPQIGNEKTNLVNTTTKRIYPQLNSLDLKIE